MDQLLLYKNEALDAVIEWMGTSKLAFLNNPMFEVIELEQPKHRPNKSGNQISLLDLFAILYDRGLVSKNWSSFSLCFSDGPDSSENSQSSIKRTIFELSVSLQSYSDSLNLVVTLTKLEQ